MRNITPAEAVYRMLRKQVQDNSRKIDRKIIQVERAEIAGGLEIRTLAQAPLLIDGARNGNLLFISNGRKTGEGAGLGTGVPAYFNETTDTWKVFFDDSDVVV